jgi:hypothetical protein
MRNVILTGLLFAMAFPSAAASKDHDTSVDPPPCSPKMRQVVLNQVLQRFAHHPFHGDERAPALFAYVTTSDSDVFLGVQQELLFEMLQAVERVGAALAVPLLETSHTQELAPASR